MKTKSIAILCLMVIIAVALNYVAFFGWNIGDSKYDGMFDETKGIRKGIDLAGGSVITFQADAENPTEEEMGIVETIFTTRLNNEGYTEARISRSEAGKITVEIPSMFETDKAADLLGSTAKLRFVNSAGETVIEGSDIKNATHLFGQPSEGAPAQDYVQVEFTTDGAVKFAAATKEAASKMMTGENYISIMMDDTEQSRPMVREEINSSSCVITGNFTAETAAMLANQIKSGHLPFNLIRISQDTVGAELGSEALPTSLLAAGIGILLIMVFMVVVYRLPGLVADLALLIYIGIMCNILGFAHVNLSLSGIAGIVLSIGMAVDANVIIFERMKEEIKLGRTIKAGVEAGFAKAFSAIFDSNVTTIITCIVLGCSGIGTITGFAITLGIGVAVSMFTAIVVTRFLLKQVVRLNISNRKLFCA